MGVVVVIVVVLVNGADHDTGAAAAIPVLLGEAGKKATASP